MSPVETVNGTPVTATEPRFDPLALAEAEAIRTRAEADAEARRIAAEAEAEASKIKAAEEAERLRIINERAAMKLEREKAEHAAKVADLNRKREEAERQAAEARAKAEAERQTQAAQANERQAADKKWRSYALGFYIVCAIVALPVQVAAFWNPDAWWLVVAPLMLEGGAWVVLKGAAAAVASHRPHWHYRAIAWVIAFIAAGINLKHGLDAFDPATAFGTAFASLAGPGVWDLYENGQIRKRDGVKGLLKRRKERKAAEKEARRLAEEKAAEQARQRAEKEAREKAEADAAKQLAEDRAKYFPEVWQHALKLAAALGKTAVTEAIWERACEDINGAKPGDDVETIRARNRAKAQVESALTGIPVNRVAKGTNEQRAIQMKTPAKRSSYKPTPPRRQIGDTPRYHRAARAAAADAKRKANAANKPADTATD